MIAFFKNIVFLLLTFNILTVHAASVKLDLLNEEAKYISAEFKGALNLPHPIIFKQILDKKDNNYSGRLFVIAYYFDAKYQDDAIEYDFSEDVSTIFPELTPEEVIVRTNLIRKAVKTYRWGKKKYTDLAIEMTVPKEPPLLVDDDEYALLETIDYIPTPEDSFTVINDFKKVVSYSDNPKDIKAMEAYHLRKLEKKENKTDYEKFTYMLNKIELSKIPSYGIDLPNPFIGNAGMGKWVEQDGFKARSVSELGQINNSISFIAGLHINTPSHRFILANSLSDKMQKPQISLTETQNIKSYKVFYPLSTPTIDDNMINAYSDNFLFPILIETINPQEDIFFNARIDFQDCDIRLDCIQRKIDAPLYIEKGPDNIPSSIKNFVRQSYYNIPTEHNKHIKIDNAYIDISKDGETAEKINFIFSYTKEPKNFSILIEDNHFTTFSAPKININDNKIYVSITPLSNQKKLINKPLTITTKLDGSSYIRKEIIPKPYSVEQKKIQAIGSFILISYLSGLLFNFMPAGLMLLLLSLSFINVKANTKQNVYYITITVTSILSSLFFFLYISFFNTNIYWGNQYNNIIYLSSCTFISLALYFSLKYKQSLMLQYPKTKSILFSLTLILFIPFSCTPYLAQNFNYVDFHNHKEAITFIFCTMIGVLTPYILIALWQTKYTHIKITETVNKWISCIQQYTSMLTVMYFIGLFFLQISSTSLINIIIIFIIYILLCKYFFNFIEALYKTDLSYKKKHITENILLIIAAILIFFIISKTNEKATLKLNQNPILIDQEQIDDMLRQNKNILISITPNWSYIATLNDIITFNNYTLERLKKNYNLEYISIKAPYISPQILQYINTYNRYSLPIYVLYTINMNKGIVLPKIIKNTELEKTIKNFML